MPFLYFCRRRFVEIGRYYCSYKAFNLSLRPRQCLDSELMNVWIEKFNHEANILSNSNSRQKRKYAFTQHMTVSYTGICIRSFFSFLCSATFSPFLLPLNTGAAYCWSQDIWRKSMYERAERPKCKVQDPKKWPCELTCLFQSFSKLYFLVHIPIRCDDLCWSFVFHFTM